MTASWTTEPVFALIFVGRENHEVQSRRRRDSNLRIKERTLYPWTTNPPLKKTHCFENESLCCYNKFICSHNVKRLLDECICSGVIAQLVKLQRTQVRFPAWSLEIPEIIFWVFPVYILSDRVGFLYYWLKEVLPHRWPNGEEKSKFSFKSKKSMPMNRALGKKYFTRYIL